MTTSRKEGGKVKMNGDLPVEVNAVSHKNGNSFLTFSVRYFFQIVLSFLLFHSIMCLVTDVISLFYSRMIVTLPCPNSL